MFIQSGGERLVQNKDQGYDAFMHRLQPSLLILAITLAGCVPMKSGTSPQPQSSSSAASTPAVAMSSDAESSAANPAEKMKTLRTLFQENEHHFFVVLATEKDKLAANNKAKDLGAWVLSTDLASELAPHLYAVVYGPFFDHQTAAERLQYLHKQIREQIQNPYVKDAGKLSVPKGLRRYALSIPLRALLAIEGRVTGVPLNAVDIGSKWEEEGGTLCERRSSVYVFTAMYNGKIIRDSMSPNEIALYKDFLRQPNPSPDRLDWTVQFDLMESTGEVFGTQLCFD